MGRYPKEEYVAAIDGITKKPLIIPCQGPSPVKKTLVIPWGESTEAPLIIPCWTLRIPVILKTKMVIRGPSPTLYKSNKVVPWGYDSTVYVNGLKQECEPSTSQGHVVTNIAGTGGMTCTGRIYGSERQTKNDIIVKD